MVVQPVNRIAANSSSAVSGTKEESRQNPIQPMGDSVVASGQGHKAPENNPRGWYTLRERYKALRSDPQHFTTVHRMLAKAGVDAEAAGPLVGESPKVLKQYENGTAYFHPAPVAKMAKFFNRQPRWFARQVVTDNIVVKWGDHPRELRKAVKLLAAASEPDGSLVARNFFGALLTGEIEALQADVPQLSDSRIARKIGLSPEDLARIKNGKAICEFSTLPNFTKIGPKYGDLVSTYIASQVAAQYGFLGPVLRDAMAHIEKMLPKTARPAAPPKGVAKR